MLPSSTTSAPRVRNWASKDHTSSFQLPTDVTAWIAQRQVEDSQSAVKMHTSSEVVRVTILAEKGDNEAPCWDLRYLLTDDRIVSEFSSAKTCANSKNKTVAKRKAAAESGDGNNTKRPRGRPPKEMP